MKGEFLKSRILFAITVKEDGTFTSSVADRDEKSDLVAEANRVLSKMEKWNPATRNGKAVGSEYLYPIINGKDSTRNANKIFREGVSLFSQSDLQGALSRFSEVIAINEEDEDAHFNRGICYIKLGDTAAACKDWNLPFMRCQVAVVNLQNKYCGANISLDKIPSPKECGQLVYTIVEEMPSFKGGEKVMLKYIGENIIYPFDARQKQITGRVYVSFVVDKSGYVREPKILRGIGGGCDQEALRVVQSMPQWNPGYQNGRPVNVQFNLPVYFELR
jgi:TonB family protein